MAPKGVSNWKRPYTSIYNDNYKYGTGLYSNTLTDIEKRYADSMSKTQLRSDRPDLSFTTFAGSTLTSSPTPGASSDTTNRLARQTSRTSTSPPRELGRSISVLEGRASSAMQCLDEEVQEAINSRIEKRRQKAIKAAEDDAFASLDVTQRPARPKSLYDDAEFWSLPKLKKDISKDVDVDSGRSKKKGSGLTTTNGPSSSQWREKSRVLQEQVESLESSMSSCGHKLQSELSGLKSRYHSEVSDLNSAVELTTQQVGELQKLCKRQALQITSLQSAYEDAQRNVQDALEEVSLWQNKCKSLKKEMDRLREEVEQAITRKSKA